MTQEEKAEWANDMHIKQTTVWLSALQNDIKDSITQHVLKGIVTDADKSKLDVARGQYMLITTLVDSLYEALPAVQELPRKK